MKRFLYLCFSFIWWQVGQAQDLEKSIWSKTYTYEPKSDMVYKNTAFISPFRWYKKFVSSQDVPNACGFSPSCSEYSKLAFKKLGLFSGILATFDRLSRCNGKQSPAFYVYDPEKKRFLDDFSDHPLP